MLGYILIMITMVGPNLSPLTVHPGHHAHKVRDKARNLTLEQGVIAQNDSFRGDVQDKPLMHNCNRYNSCYWLAFCHILYIWETNNRMTQSSESDT